MSVRLLVFIAAIVMLGSSVAAQRNNTPEARLRAAMDKETVDGDLDAAIQGYRQVISQRGAGREVVAHALLRLGLALEHRGSKEAAVHYDRLIREFGDQAAVVQQARGRLSASPAVASTTTLRQVCVNDCQNASGVSPDGRWIALRPNTGLGGLALRELTGTGTLRQIVQAPVTGRIFSPQFSPDSKRIAYEHSGTGVVLINIDGSGRRVLRDEGAPMAWSPDGRRLLVATWKGQPNDNGRLGWLTVSDGSFDMLPTTHSLFYSAVVSPDGKSVAFSIMLRAAGATPADAYAVVYVMASDGSGETLVTEARTWNEPVGWSADGKHLFYMQRDGRGTLLWKVPVTAGKIQGPAYVTSTPFKGEIAGIVGFAADGTLYFLIRTPAVSDIYTAQMDATTGKVSSAHAAARTMRNGSNAAPKWSPDSRTLLFSTVPSAGTDGELYVLRSDGPEQRIAPTLPFVGGGYCWTRDGSAVLANLRLTGQSPESQPMRVNPSTGTVAPVYATNAMFMQDCSGEYLIPTVRVSTTNPQSGIAVRHIEKGVETASYGYTSGRLTKPTISRDGRHVAFLENKGDRAIALMVVPSAGGAAREIARAQSPVQFEVTGGLAWSPDNRFVYFLRRADGRSMNELFRVPVDGGREESMGLRAADLRDIDISPDGQRIAFSLGPKPRPEIWAIGNFGR